MFEIHGGRTIAGAVLALTLAGCGAEGAGVTAGPPPPVGPTIACPTLSADARPVEDPRLSAYTEEDLAGLVDQRASYDLCDVPADRLFDDPGAIALYEEHGIVLLPEEEQYWLDLQGRYRPARQVVEQMRTRPGFLAARSNVREGTVTIWVTAETLEAFRAQAEDAGAGAGCEFRAVRYDLAAMESLRDDLLARLPAEAEDAVVDIDIEPDRLVVDVDQDHPALGEAEEALAGAAPIARRAVDVDAEIDVHRTDGNVGTTD